MTTDSNDSPSRLELAMATFSRQPGKHWLEEQPAAAFWFSRVRREVSDRALQAVWQDTSAVLVRAKLSGEELVPETLYHVHRMHRQAAEECARRGIPTTPEQL